MSTSYGLSGTRSYRRPDRPDDAPARTKRGGYAEVGGGGGARVDTMADGAGSGSDAEPAAASAAADPRSATGHAVWSEHRKREQARRAPQPGAAHPADAPQPARTPLPMGPMVALAIVHFTFASMVNIIWPLAPSMVPYLRGTEEDTGLYLGMMARCGRRCCSC